MPFSSPPPSPVFAVLKQLLPLAILVLAIPLLTSVLRPLRKTGRDRAKARGQSVRQDTKSTNTDKVSALQRAERGSFSKKSLFNKSELGVFRLLEDEIRSATLPLRVMGQTSMHGFLETDGQYETGGSYYALSDRRMDFVIANGEGDVVLAIEYNGGGHFQNNSEKRDAIKAIALGKADIPFLTIEAGEGETLVRQRIRHKLGIAEPM